VQRPSTVQRPVLQSVPSMHWSPVAQRASQSGPPQSVSVSSPLVVPSVHEASSQTPFVVQRSLVQSLGASQDPPGGHAGHVPPPQSTDVSAPSSLPLSQGSEGLEPPAPPVSEAPPLGSPPPDAPELPPEGSLAPAAPASSSALELGSNAYSGQPQDAAMAAATNAPIPRMPTPRIGRPDSNIVRRVATRDNGLRRARSVAGAKMFFR
jgi:hypothetical protein